MSSHPRRPRGRRRGAGTLVDHDVVPIDHAAPRIEVSPNAARRPGYLARAMLALIRLYQRGISPGLNTMCRFEPSCSRYAYEAIEVHGAGSGLWLAARRLGRCHPGTPGGYDPVPPRT